MVFDRVEVTIQALRQATGWEIKPEGACKDELCVPLPGVDTGRGTIDLLHFAEAMGMPVAADAKHGVWAVGPRSGGRVLDRSTFPQVELPDFEGNSFDVTGRLRDRKVLLLAWASW